MKRSPDRALQARHVEEWHLDTDVAIVGMGGAGASAAIEAADAGARVTVFELGSAPGGSTALSGGEVYLGGSGGTSMQQRFGFSDSTDNFYDYLMMQHGELADPAKVRAYAEGAAEHFEWLVDQGVPFKESFTEERLVEPMTDDCLFFSGNEKAWPEVERCAPVPRAHTVQLEGMGAGGVLMSHLQAAVASRAVDVHTDARVLCLIEEEDGSVVGLVVRIDGAELNCRAHRGVVLCAGGFIMNEEMVKRHAPKLTQGMPIGNPGDTGAGIQMGQSVGGVAINMHEGFMSIPFYPPASLTYGIVVNDKGQRFVNEDAYHGRVGTRLIEQATERAYFIADVEAYGTYEDMSFLGATVAGTGETVAELEAELQLPEGTLQSTVAYYNEHAGNGEDPLFHKQAAWLRPLEAPYVALDVTPGRGCYIPCFTLGGLDTEPTGEVKRVDGSHIPGLYAAGRTAAGVPRNGSGYNSGISIGDATFTGRRAGKAAAART